MNFNWQDLGLELTNNSKVGWAFSLPRNKTCIHATPLCKKLCYGNGIRYQSFAQKGKRERNFTTAEYLLGQGGPTLLAENLVLLAEQARPKDWLPARIASRKPVVPWTLRIHDVGDFYSADYATAWLIAIENSPECAFWFYTRSFPDDQLFEVLTKLAALPNCRGWLSVDMDNYEKAILAKCKSSGVWNLALLQSAEVSESVVDTIQGQIYAVQNQADLIQDQADTVPDQVDPIQDQADTVPDQVDPIQDQADTVQNQADAVQDQIDIRQHKTNFINQRKSPAQIVSFPYHRGGHHLTPLRHEALTVCPAVTGAYKLNSNKNSPSPCQICTICLPPQANSPPF